ncbi:PDZ domain-containing protein [Streptomyces dioscori]|uniref:PDZ domain-containing protein n=1 Tax=Streptomyces dioscori TaxID=2109333 RepID=A0A2P8PUK2_9ACTN|nr:S1C family serine protease [Streptomyces dioscori]PSM37674.1 PDZ domain-containing protein [Streptomyces dioscori]
MEQTVLRPKPMPGQEPPGQEPGGQEPGGQEPGGGDRPSGPGHRPHAARRRGRRLTTLAFSLFVGTVLVLSGVGLGTVGATVIGMSRLAESQGRASAAEAPAASGAPGGTESGLGRGTESDPGRGIESGPGGGSPAALAKPSERPGSSAAARPGERPTLGVEAVDAPDDPGALLVGVHVPGPGHTAGLVRGDVLLVLGTTRVDSAADLARAVAAVRPGEEIGLTLRHASGGHQQVSVTPGVIT